MEMNIELEATAKPLDHRHGATLSVAHARGGCSAAIEAKHGAHGDAEHRAAERVIVGEEIAQSVRQGEHPLAHGDVWQDVIDETGGLLRHAATATTRAEPPLLARERDQALEGTALAPNACEAPAQRPTRDELAKLALDEAGEPVTVAAVGGLAQERFQVLADDAMEDRACRVPGLIRDGAHGRRGSDVRAGRRTAVLRSAAQRSATAI